MRLLITTDAVGGVWTFTRELTEGLLACGHAVAHVTIGRAPGSAQADWCEQTARLYGSQFLHETVDVPLEWMAANTSAYDAAEASLLTLAQAFRADLVHANQFCFGALPVGVPKVVTAHSDVMSWAEACRPAGLVESGWLHQYRELVSTGLGGADRVVAPTHWMADTLSRSFGCTKPVHVVLNGRTVPLVDEEQSLRKLQAVTAGRWWDEGKDLRVLEGLEAVMPVQIAGEAAFDGDQATTPSGVTMHGLLSEPSLLALFRQSAVYVATSIYEPFGLAPLEAALCGCAVVANDIPSLREVWGDSAIYFRGAEQLRLLLDRLVAEPDVLRSARLRSRARGLQLSAMKMVDGYLELYTALLEEAGVGLALKPVTYA